MVSDWVFHRALDVVVVRTDFLPSQIFISQAVYDDPGMGEIFLSLFNSIKNIKVVLPKNFKEKDVKEERFEYLISSCSKRSCY